MLICTKLIDQLQEIFEITQKWNILPIHYPYQIEINKIKPKYKLTVHPSFLKRDWIFQIILLILTAFFGFYKAYFEYTSIFYQSIILFFVFYAIFFVIIAIFHKIE